jgi:hypothetical protein
METANFQEQNSLSSMKVECDAAVLLSKIQEGLENSRLPEVK